jgi:hypothetical protein
MEKRQPLQQMLLGKVVTHLQKTETTSVFITLYHLKLGQRRAGNKLKLIGISNDFLSRTQMAQQLRVNIEN